MDIKERTEKALVALVNQLIEIIRKHNSIQLINHYQLRIDISATEDKSSYPDAYVLKWRYLFGLILANGLQAPDNPIENTEQIDHLLEKIYDLYVYDAIYTSIKENRKEKEFLVRLKFATQARQPDIGLAYPEQIRSWSIQRFSDFDSDYFYPIFGVSVVKIYEWIDSLIKLYQDRLQTAITDFREISTDLKKIQRKFIKGELSAKQAKSEAKWLNLENRLSRNRAKLETVHILTMKDMENLPYSDINKEMIKLFSIDMHSINQSFRFPHEPNPIDQNFFIPLNSDSYHMLDCATLYMILSRKFENDLIQKFGQRYYKRRSKLLEQKVANLFCKIFDSQNIYQNYYLYPKGKEKDICILAGNVLILIECKHAAVRPVKGRHADLLNLEKDFKDSVQYAFNQAKEVKKAILSQDETKFFDKNGKVLFSLRRNEVDDVFIICVTSAFLGTFEIDLSLLLQKDAVEPFPWAVNIFDFETICKYINTPKKFISYCRGRQKLHGRVFTGDELNYAGWFYKYGNLDIEVTILGDDFSGVFEREWYREQGIPIAEPIGPPSILSLWRHDGKIEYNIFDDSG